MPAQYSVPLAPDTPLDIRYALALAVRRWGRQAALRVEDGGVGLAVFRGRYRVGHLKAGFVASTAPFFIEHGAGDSFDLAFADADLQERRP